MRFRLLCHHLNMFEWLFAWDAANRIARLQINAQMKPWGSRRRRRYDASTSIVRERFGFLFFFGWMCLVCKAYLILLSFTQTFVFLMGCWNSPKQAWVKWRPSFPGTPPMSIMPNTWTKRSHDVNPGKQSVFADCLRRRFWFPQHRILSSNATFDFDV